ncbi:acetyl-CoA carboxylase, biotin carboxyl carrier protein, partial [Bacillus licheniformis]
MLNIDEIRQLIKLIDESSINEFTYENEGSKV